MDQEQLIARLISWILWVVALTIHEWAHAWSAFKLGDDTAARQGRMTFNPISHIDLLGTVIMPLIGAPLAWAKPVPINPFNFRRDISPATGMMLTAIAGPISNMVQAACALLLLAGLSRFQLLGGDLAQAFVRILFEFLLLNIVLAVFNLFPIPPLDGSRVAAFLMPRRFEPAWEKFVGITPIPLFALIMLPRLTDGRIDLIGPPIDHVTVFALDILKFLSG